MADINSTGKIRARAQLYRLLSAGFSYPDNKNFKDFRNIANALMKEASLSEVNRQLIRQVLPEIKVEVLRPEYTRLFIKGLVPIADKVICNTPVANQVRMRSRRRENPGMLAHSLEYAADLLDRRVDNSDPAGSDELYSGYRLFLAEKLSNFAIRFTERLAGHCTSHAYLLLRQLLETHILEEIQLELKGIPFE